MEIWKPIPQIPDYWASNEGHIRKGTWGVILKPRKQSLDSYHKIGIIYNGKQTPFRVHRMVAAAWHGLDIFDRTIEVHHKDEDKSNNREDNLECLLFTRHQDLHAIK